ncbi:MAG: hypothetical protein E7280_05805 [Lachnospiraceae bacterium]|nr:hypothetical protein [Lachnospiraceae bacterium]
MKNIRKVLGILAIFILVTGVKCHAAGIQENPTDTEMNNSAIIKSVTITPEMREYAKNILSVHLAQNENAISFGSNLKQFRLGKIVSVYNKNNDDIIFLAPIVRRGKLLQH